MQRLALLISVLVMSGFLAATAGCAAGAAGGGPTPNPGDNNPPPDDNGNNSNDNDAGRAVVKTRIIIGDSHIDAGDDLIVFGVAGSQLGEGSSVNQPQGISFVRPSQCTNQTATSETIPGSDVLFNPDEFKVAQRKIALIRSTLALSIFDTDTGRLVDIPAADVTLDPLGPPLRSDGPFIAAVARKDFVSSLKVIDVSGDDPRIISPPSPDLTWQDVAVHAASRQVVALVSDHFFLYNLDTPDAEPVEFDSPDGIGIGVVDTSAPIQFDGRRVLFQVGTGLSEFDTVALLDVTNGEVTILDENPSGPGRPLALAAGSFGYFLNRESADTQNLNFDGFRSAIGRADQGAGAVLADQFGNFIPLRKTASQGCRDPRLVGYGRTMCVTPDGGRWFMGDFFQASSFGVPVQVSTGGAFSDLPEPDGDSTTGSLMGADVVCTSDVVAFRGLREVDNGGECVTEEFQVIAFIRVSELGN